MTKENNPVISQQEKYFLNTFPLINQIILKKVGFVPSRLVDDLVQQVRFKLWRWKQTQQKEITFDEWQRLANVAANNEVIDYQRKKENQNILFSELAEDQQSFPLRFHQQVSVEGETNYESLTLLLLLWRKFQQLSLRQKYAFLLNKYEFVNFLLKFGCCTPKEVADSLALSENEFIELLKQIPLNDAAILNLLAEKFGEQLTEEQIWTARSKAKANLMKSLPG